MKTSVNVMGFQAKDMLERISSTLKAVMRTGKENKAVQIIEDPSLELAGSNRETGQGSDGELSVFASRDPVFYEEKLLAEIPEPNWSGGLPVQPRLLVDQGGREESPGNHCSRNGKNRPKREGKKQTADMSRQRLSIVALPVEQSTQAREPRDLRSSPSPPAGTAAT